MASSALGENVKEAAERPQVGRRRIVINDREGVEGARHKGAVGGVLQVTIDRHLPVRDCQLVESAGLAILARAGGRPVDMEDDRAIGP